jgi:hypothetical protein
MTWIASIHQLAAGLLRVLGDPLRDAVHQRVRKALFDRFLAPLETLLFLGPTGFQGAGELDHALGRRIWTGIFDASGPPVQHNVFGALAQLRVEIVVDADHARVDDAHRHAGLDRVVEEDGVDRLARGVVAAERKAHVGNATAHLAYGRFWRIQRVASM